MVFVDRENPVARLQTMAAKGGLRPCGDVTHITRATYYTYANQRPIPPKLLLLWRSISHSGSVFTLLGLTRSEDAQLEAER
jgi:hypothetical protein